MFKKPVVLSSEKHAALKFKPVGGFTYAKDLHMVPICLAEFYVAAQEYPIVFVQVQDDYVPVALTGLKEGQNIYIDDDGVWNARYVPAAVRAYPFGFVNQDDEKSLVLIDEAYPGFGVEEGIPLFDEKKSLSTDLQTKLDFLRQHRGQLTLTKAFVSRLKELNLLSEKTALFGPQSQPQFQIKGVWAVDEQKLYGLKDDQLLEFARKGYLALATAHLMSMQCFGELFRKVNPVPQVEEKSKSKKSK